jgi:hypothetical protein
MTTTNTTQEPTMGSGEMGDVNATINNDATQETMTMTKGHETRRDMTLRDATRRDATRHDDDDDDTTRETATTRWARRDTM